MLELMQRYPYVAIAIIGLIAFKLLHKVLKGVTKIIFIAVVVMVCLKLM